MKITCGLFSIENYRWNWYPCDIESELSRLQINTVFWISHGLLTVTVPCIAAVSKCSPKICQNMGVKHYLFIRSLPSCKWRLRYARFYWTIEVHDAAKYGAKGFSISSGWRKENLVPNWRLLFWAPPLYWLFLLEVLAHNCPRLSCFCHFHLSDASRAWRTVDVSVSGLARCAELSYLAAGELPGRYKVINRMM